MKRLTMKQWLITKWPVVKKRLATKWPRKKDRLHITDLFKLLLDHFIWCDVDKDTIQKDIGDYSITIQFVDKRRNK